MGGGRAKGRKEAGEEAHRLRGGDGSRTEVTSTAEAPPRPPTTSGGDKQRTPQHLGAGGEGARGPGRPDAPGGGGEEPTGQQEGERGVHGGGQTAPGKSKTLVILYTNAQSLAGKVNELSCIASDIKPDIIALTETWCNNDITNAVISIDGYEIVPDLRMDRMDTGGGRGGGASSVH